MGNRFNSSRGIAMAGDPTQKQIEYARAIHELLGKALPEEITKQAYSDYIDRHAAAYKEAVGKMTGGM